MLSFQKLGREAVLVAVHIVPKLYGFALCPN